MIRKIHKGHVPDLQMASHYLLSRSIFSPGFAVIAYLKLRIKLECRLSTKQTIAMQSKPEYSNILS